MELLMDPYVITPPPCSAGAEKAINFLNQLSQWTQIIMDKEHHFWFSEPALLALWDSGNFPLPHKLEELLLQTNVEICDIGTASRAFEILTTPPYLDDELVENSPNLHEILIDEKQILVIPEEIASRLDPQIANGLSETLLKLAYSQQLRIFSLANDLVFATSDIEEETLFLTVEGECYQANEDSMIRVTGKWSAVTSPNDLSVPEDLYNFWQETEKAVEWAYQDLIQRRELEPTKHKIPSRANWRTGHHFNESILKNHFDRDDLLPEIFHAVVKVLVGFWGKTEHNHNHHLKHKAFQVRRLRDNALAWRAHVTNEPDRIRLHYWRLNEKDIELSNVVYKKDLGIEQD